LKAPRIEASAPAAPKVAPNATSMDELRQEARATFIKGKADGSLTTALGFQQVQASLPSLKAPGIQL